MLSVMVQYFFYKKIVKQIIYEYTKQKLRTFWPIHFFKSKLVSAYVCSKISVFILFVLIHPLHLFLNKFKEKRNTVYANVNLINVGSNWYHTKFYLKLIK